MPTPQTIARIEQLIWIFIYIGLFVLVTGLAALQPSPATAWTLIVAGGVLVTAGAVLIWVRSLFNEGTIAGSKTQGKDS